MNLKSIRENLVRRLGVNYVAYMGQKSLDQEWLNGYHQAKKDCENFLEQLSIYQPVETKD